ncbi:hypothetical protein Acr_00g0056260 [Actinidia rufa]|uniref:Retrovirus-related Pol polyprotein from transposon TNT 1-94-like beta-barrel domain-containing protein n=1 Tax=Actinidia rufa TaxID=165716 RepID=A0A7J0DMF8_9ERIC|nr:hypothetical protein Acr_00g0056260 [Actinidia rufa]
MYQAKTSRNNALLMRRLVNLKLQRETIVAEHTSLIASEFLARELGDIGGFSQQFSAEWEVDYEDCPKYKAQVQSLDTAATAVMVDDDEIDVLLAASDDGKSDWILDSGSAYHLCRDREVFSTYAACEGRILMANNTSSRVISRGSVQLRMADGRSVTLIEREEWTREATVAQKYAKQAQGYLEDRSGTRAQGDALGYVRKSGQTRVIQPVQDVHREAQRKETKSILRSCTAKGAQQRRRRRDGAMTTRKIDVLCGAPRWGVGGTPVGGCKGTSSYGGVGSEAVRKDNLKMSDYPPVGWRGRLLSPAHLDESKPTWMSPSPVAKPKPDWSSYGVSM